jgi:hypothetical protein
MLRKGVGASVLGMDRLKVGLGDSELSGSRGLIYVWKDTLMLNTKFGGVFRFICTNARGESLKAGVEPRHGRYIIVNRTTRKAQ